ncbi:MAG TPA: hypothetical protein VF695_03155 [Sphingomonas sp.]
MANTKETAMITHHAIAPIADLSGLAPIIGSAISMLGMLILVAGSAVPMMV